MGGKTKQSQRTKNNVRPSSSGRSAELLSNVKLDTNLVNIGGGKVLPALFPTLVVASMDQGLDPEIQMCLKKLNKKDPITKSKALQELTDLVSNGKEDDVVAALPSWVHFYKILTADTDRKVREFTQMCHGAIMKACGRRAAPQLRALVPAWLQAQYDDHAPAHAHALHSLTSTFPDNKLPEVISFCKTEVMTHLLENLIGNVESALCKRIESPEEKELQKIRVVTSSLRGLEYFVRQLPAPLDPWLWVELAPLLQAASFWNLVSHTAHQLRAAWFCTVGVIVERFKGQFGEQCGARTLRLIVAASRDVRAYSAAPLWDCTLLFMHHVPDWHKYLDKKELFTKRILDVLEGGGWGDAKHLSNMLLPLLAQLPEDMLTRQFYEDFFNAIFVGLEKKSILSSKSERQSWMSSLAECLRYLSVQNDDYVVEVVTLIHRTWLERIFSPLYDPQIKVNLIKCSATNMASLIKYWLKQSKEDNEDKYDQLTRNFWQNVGSTVLTQIDKLSTDHEEIARLIDGHTLLLQTLKMTFAQEAKKKQSIKFDGDVQPDSEETSVPKQQCDASITERYKHNLNETVERICSQYFEFAEKKQVSSAVLTPLYTVIIDFDSKNLFLALARQFNTDSVYKFYDKWLRTWLSGDTMRCKLVADIVFLSIKYLSEQEQKCVLESFKQFPPPVVEWCISLSLSHPYCTIPSVRDWLKGSLVEESVRVVSRRAVIEGDGHARNLLLMCLAQDCDGELAISVGAVSGIVQTLRSALEGGDGGGGDGEGSCERAARLAGALATALAACSAATHDHTHYRHLLFNLFTLNLRHYRGGGGGGGGPPGAGNISVETWVEARSSWQDGLAALDDTHRDNFLRRAADVMHTRLQTRTNDLNIPEIEHVVSLCPYLLDRRDDSHLSDDVTQIISFTKLLFDAQSVDRKIVEKYALRYECVTCNMNCPFDDDNDSIKAIVEESTDSELSELTKEDFIAYANDYILRATYLKTILLHKVGEEEDEEQNSWCNILLDEQYVQTAVCQLLYDYVVVCSLHEGYAFWTHYSFIQKTKQKLDSLLEDIIKESAPEVRSKITALLSELAATKGYYWSYAMKYYEVNTKSELNSSESEAKKTEETLDSMNLEEVLTGNGFFHSLQANDKWSPNEQSSYRTKYLIMLRSIYAAHATEPAVLDELFVADVARGQRECNLDVVVNLYYRHNDTMLYERDICAAPWRQVVSNAGVVEFLRAAVERGGWDLPPHHWDFITITLCSILTSVEKSTQAVHSTKVCLLAMSALRLYESVQRFVGSVPSESERRVPAAHVAHLPTEWADMFAPDLAHNILLLLLTNLKCHSSKLTSPSSQLIGAVMCSVKLVSWATAPASARADGGALSLRRVATQCATVLSAPAHPFYKYLAYSALRMLAEPLVLDDAEKLAMWTSDSDDSLAEADEVKQRPELSLELFHHAYKHLEEIVDTALSHIRVGEETCEMVPFTDSYSMSLGWLLLVAALAEAAELARGDLVHHYIQIYREKQYSEKALVACLRLVPADVFQFGREDHSPLPPPHAAQHLFLAVQDFSVSVGPVASTVSALACRGVFVCVGGAGGGAARGWRGAASPREARLLDRLVRTYVTPHLVREQLHNLHKRAHELQDAEVRVVWSSQEASCVYQVEERHVELRVWLSRDHPLSLPRVATPLPVPAALQDTHWVAVYLGYQRGSLLNAFKMWISAVSARVEAAPQCYICYCRLHPDTGHLPRVLCRQCRNRFHNSCLRKWFTTSNKSNCPLCRAVF